MFGVISCNECMDEIADEYKRAATLIEGAARCVSEPVNAADCACKAFARDLELRILLLISDDCLREQQWHVTKSACRNSKFYGARVCFIALKFLGLHCREL